MELEFGAVPELLVIFQLTALAGPNHFQVTNNSVSQLKIATRQKYVTSRKLDLGLLLAFC
jgi:hypothetical protein